MSQSRASERAALAISILAAAGVAGLFFLRPGVSELEQEIKGLRTELAASRGAGNGKAKGTAEKGDGAAPVRPIRSLALLPVSGPDIDEVKNMNENLPGLLRKHLGVTVIALEKDKKLKQPNDPLAAGAELGADAVLSGEISLSNFVSATEFALLQLDDVETGATLWSKKLIVRDGRDEKADRIEGFAKLRRLTGEIVAELSERWPKKTDK